MANDYHREIGWPDVPFPTGNVRLRASGHARREAQSDRYGGFSLPSSITLTEKMYRRDPHEAVGETTQPHVFEITVESGRVVKLGVRTHYDDDRDLVLIVRPWDNLIVTAWINVKDDPHDTLNEEKYVAP